MQRPGAAEFAAKAKAREDERKRKEDELRRRAAGDGDDGHGADFNPEEAERRKAERREAQRRRAQAAPQLALLRTLHRRPSAPAAFAPHVPRPLSFDATVGLARHRAFRAWKKRWVPYHERIAMAYAFWALHDSPRYGTIKGYCLATLRKGRARYNFGALPRLFRRWAFWNRDRVLERKFSGMADTFRERWSRKRAITTLVLNVGWSQRERRAANMFLPGLKARSFRKWALNVQSQKNLRWKLWRHRTKWVVRSAFSMWQGNVVLRGQVAAIQHTMAQLIGDVEEDVLMDKGADLWRRLWLRRIWDALVDNVTEQGASRLAYTYWQRTMFNRWKRLKAHLVIEGEAALQIQCAWRMHEAKGSHLKALRLWKLKEAKKREAEEAEQRRNLAQIMLIKRLVFKWKDARNRRLAKEAEAAAEEAHKKAIREGAVKDAEHIKAVMTRYEEKMHQEWLGKKATVIQSWWKAFFFRTAQLYYVVIMKKTEHLREANAARILQRMYRNKNEVQSAYALVVQRNFRAYQGRLRSRLQKKVVQRQAKRAKQYKFIAAAMKLLGKRSYTDRIAKFEILELFGILTPDPEVSVENEERERRRLADEAKQRRKWTMDEGSLRDRQILLFKEKHLYRNLRRAKFWWTKNVMMKYFPKDFETFTPVRKPLPRTAQKQLMLIARRERSRRVKELRERTLQRHVAALRIQTAFRGKRVHFIMARKRRKRFLRAQDANYLVNLENLGIRSRAAQEKWIKRFHNWHIIKMERMVVSKPLEDAFWAVIDEKRWGIAEAAVMAGNDPYVREKRWPQYKYRVFRQWAEAEITKYQKDKQEKQLAKELDEEKEAERQARKAYRRETLGDDYFDSSDSDDTDLMSTDSLRSALSRGKLSTIFEGSRTDGESTRTGSRSASRAGSRRGSRQGKNMGMLGTGGMGTLDLDAVTERTGDSDKDTDSGPDSARSKGSSVGGASETKGGDASDPFAKGRDDGSDRGSVASRGSSRSSRSRRSKRSKRSRALSRAKKGPGGKKHDHSHHDSVIEIFDVVDLLVTRVENQEVSEVLYETIDLVASVQGMVDVLEADALAEEHSKAFDVDKDADGGGAGEGKGVDEDDDGKPKESDADREMRESYEVYQSLQALLGRVEENVEEERERETAVKNVLDLVVTKVEHEEVNEVLDDLIVTLEDAAKHAFDVDDDFADALNANEAAGRAAALLTGQKYFEGEMFQKEGTRVKTHAWDSGFNYYGHPAKCTLKPNEDPELKKGQVPGGDGDVVHAIDSYKFKKRKGGEVLYMGWWRNGRPNGIGNAMYRRDNEANLYSANGMWLRGAWHGQITVKWVDGSFYTGIMRKGVFNGQGHQVLVKSDEDVDALEDFAREQQRLKDLADQKDDDTIKGEKQKTTLGAAATRMLKRRRSSLLREAKREAKRLEELRKARDKKRQAKEELKRRARLATQLVTPMRWVDYDVYPLDSSADEKGEKRPPWVDAREDEVPYEEYRGPFRKGKRHGARCKLRLSDGTMYSGPMVENDFHGPMCKIEYKDGNVYEGPIRRNIREGIGKLTYADGTVYEGQFVNNNPHGQGTRRFSNGDYFVGTWREGVKHGRLTLHYANGDRREGEWSVGYLRRWLCERISQRDTDGVIEYFEENPNNLVSVVAQNVLNRWRYYSKGEMCERVPPGVDPDDPRVIPMMEAIEAALKDINRREAEERLRREIDGIKGEVGAATKKYNDLMDEVNALEKKRQETQDRVREHYVHLEQAQSMMEKTQATTGKERQRHVQVFDSYKRGMRECMRALPEEKVAILASFVDPPDSLHWVLAALYMILTGDVQSPPWAEIRRVMFQGERRRTPIVNCKKFHRQMATFDPWDMDADVAQCLDDLYMQDDRFTRESVREDKATLPRLRELLVWVVDWVRYCHGAHMESQKIAVYDERIATVQAVIDARKSRWEKVKEGMIPVDDQLGRLRKKVDEARDEEFRARVMLDEAEAVFWRGEAFEEEAKLEGEAEAEVEDDELIALAGGDIEKLRRMAKQAKKVAGIEKRKLDEAKADRTKIKLDVDKIKRVGIRKLETQRQPQWAAAKEEFRRVKDHHIVAMNEAGGWAPPGPISVVARCAAVIAGMRPTWQDFQELSTDRYIAGKVDMRVVWRRKPKREFYKFFREFDPATLKPEQWDEMQPILKMGLADPANFRAPTHKYNCNNECAFALAKIVVATDNYYKIGRFIDPIKVRIKEMEEKYVSSQIEITAMEELYKVAQAEADHLKSVLRNSLRKRKKVARDMMSAEEKAVAGEEADAEGGSADGSDTDFSLSD